MDDSLWQWTAHRLREQTCDPDGAPAAGSVAAVAATLGIGLAIMAVDLTVRTGRRGPDTTLDLAAERAWLSAVADRTAEAADADARVLEGFLRALQAPRAEAADRRVRQAAVQAAAVPATEVPLALAEDCVEVIQRVHALARAVAPGVASDMLAGREVLIGAGRAALGAVRINLLQVPTDHEADFRARASAAEAFLENPDELV